MDKDFIKHIFEEHRKCPGCPAPQDVVIFFEELVKTLFPDFSYNHFQTYEALEEHLQRLQERLKFILINLKPEKAEKVTSQFFDQLKGLYDLLLLDIEAMYAGDPAAKSKAEVIRTYPGFYAITAYRVAHALHTMKVDIIPRIITEHAHSKTGIDIHPAAVIGKSFCIDHGTGVVIGETVVIGNNVKIYQGVTLGALSVEKEGAEKKRHPTIEDRIVIYAGATILGGETHIGHDSVIGGNVWLTKSVPANSKIYYQAQMYNSDTGKTDMIIYKSTNS